MAQMRFPGVEIIGEQSEVIAAIMGMNRLAALADEVQLFFEVSLMIRQPSREPFFVAVGQRRLLFRDDALDAVRPNDFKIGDMTHDLQRGPLAGNR